MSLIKLAKHKHKHKHVIIPEEIDAAYYDKRPFLRRHGSLIGGALLGSVVPAVGNVVGGYIGHQYDKRRKVRDFNYIGTGFNKIK